MCSDRGQYNVINPLKIYNVVNVPNSPLCEDYVCEIIPTYSKKSLRKHKISSDSNAVRFIRKILPKEIIPHYEIFGAIFLDTAMCTQGYRILHRGGIEKTVVDIRLLFQAALLCNATGVIIFHNHPAGNIEPSQSDLKWTEQIKSAGHVMSVKLYDSIIITESKSRSIYNNF